MELSIALEKPCYYPGDVLKCLVKARRLGNEAGTSTTVADALPDVLQLHFECSGSERVDPSWVGHLYRPDVTAVKDQRRLVRSIFSTGLVPLLENADQQGLGSGREFIVRCRLPHCLPPSYRGNAVRFVYQVVVQGKLIPQQSGTVNGSNAAQQQQQLSCQAQSGFVVWPSVDRSAALDRRISLSSTPAPGAAYMSPRSSAGGSSAAAAAAAAAAAVDSLQDTEMIEYKLGAAPLKLRWQEVVYHVDGTKTLMAHQPSAALYPGRTSTMGSSQLLSSQLSLLDSLQLDEQQLEAATGPGSAEDEDGETGPGGAARHLTPAQRASMAVRTFNLKAGDHPLMRLVLQPPPNGLLQPGGSFGMLLDFRAAHGGSSDSSDGGGTSSQQPLCLQVVALLESEEVVLAPFTHSRSSDSAAMRKLWAEQQDVTSHLLTSHFVFSIPLTAPPSFKTPMVAHKWVLRFEILLGKPKPTRPGELVTEQLLWSLPLIVFPPPTGNAANL